MLRNRYCERIGREHKSNHGTICISSISALGFICFLLFSANKRCYCSDVHCWHQKGDLLSEVLWSRLSRCVLFSEDFLQKKHSESRILSNTTCLLYFSLADYRSPIRPVPDSCLPEDIVYDQGEAQNVSNNLYLEGESYIDDEREPDSASSRDSWWLEAAKIADDLESKPKTLEPHTLVSLLNHFYYKEQQSVMFLTWLQMPSSFSRLIKE